MSRISVIVPNYNREALIVETLTNLLSQSRPPDQLIVVDDGSTDGSADLIAGFGKQVTLVRQANEGPAAARNRGMAIAEGELIQFFDSDDLCSLNKLELQARRLESSSAPFVYSPWIQARLEDGEALHVEPVLQQRALPDYRTALSWFLGGWVIVFQCCLFRRAALEAAGPYREELWIAEDSELLFRILAQGAEPVFEPGAITLYRLHSGGQISLGGIDSQRRARDWARYVDIVAEQLDTLPSIRASDRRAWRRLEWEAGRELAKAGVLPATSSPGLAQRSAWAAQRLANRVAKAVSRRAGGSSFLGPYQAGAVTDAQAALLREIGYSPVRVPF